MIFQQSSKGMDLKDDLLLDVVVFKGPGSGSSRVGGRNRKDIDKLVFFKRKKYVHAILSVRVAYLRIFLLLRSSTFHLDWTGRGD